jgi:hypothetical protein
VRAATRRHCRLLAATPMDRAPRLREFSNIYAGVHFSHDGERRAASLFRLMQRAFTASRKHPVQRR